MPLHNRSSQHPDSGRVEGRSASSVRTSLLQIALAAACASACSFSCSDERGPSNDQVRVKLPADLGGAGDGHGRSDESGECAVPGRADGGANASIDPSAGCKADDDCVRLEKGCCHLGNYIAVTKANAPAYQASLACEGKICPMILIADDHSVAQCNVETQACEVVLPNDIACKGTTTNPHACPDGWHCRVPGSTADGPGSCVQMCGGFAAIRCSDPNAQCVDDPDDDCDPKNGGADCGGICVQTTP